MVVKILIQYNRVLNEIVYNYRGINEVYKDNIMVSHILATDDFHYFPPAIPKFNV